VDVSGRIKAKKLAFSGTLQKLLHEQSFKDIRLFAYICYEKIATKRYHKAPSQQTQPYEGFDVCVSSEYLDAGTDYNLKELSIVIDDDSPECMLCPETTCFNPEFLPEKDAEYFIWPIENQKKLSVSLPPHSKDGSGSYLITPKIHHNSGTETAGYLLKNVLLHENFYTGCMLDFRGEVELTEVGQTKVMNLEI